MAEFSKYIGLDVHKETIAVAVADGEGGSVRYQGEIPNSCSSRRSAAEADEPQRGAVAVLL